MKIKQSLIALYALASSLAYAGGVAPMSVVEVVPETAIAEENFFVYASGGTATADVKDSIENGVTLLPKMLGTDSTIGEVGVGYRYTENIFVTGFAQAVYLDEVDILNFDASINYRFADFPIMPYVGLVAGYSQLTWKDVPVDTTGKQVETKLDADHATFGVQAGAEFEMTDNFTLFGKYQVMTHDHLMDIFDTSTIEHVNIQSLQGGVRYEF
jgi:opacity protein-like surface antigen